jgi:hypothetical protein
MLGADNSVVSKLVAFAVQLWDRGLKGLIKFL